MNTENKSSIFSGKINVCIFAVLCNALWGSAFPMIKMGYAMYQIPADDVGGQILFAGTRFMLAGFLTILIGSILNRKLLVLKKKNIPAAFGLAMLQTVIQYLFFYIGLANTTGVKASIIDSVSVFVALIISSVLFRFEQMSTKKIIGCILGFAGVVLINLGETGLDGGFSLTGEGFVMISTVSYGFSTVAMKYFSERELPITLSGYQFMIGGLIMAAAGLCMGGRYHVTLEEIGWQGILLIVYLAFISAAAYSIWGMLLKYNPVSKVAVYGFFNPVFGVFLSALILGEGGEAFGPKGIAALLFVCVGIYITNKGSVKKK